MLRCATNFLPLGRCTMMERFYEQINIHRMKKPAAPHTTNACSVLNTILRNTTNQKHTEHVLLVHIVFHFNGSWLTPNNPSNWKRGKKWTQIPSHSIHVHQRTKNEVTIDFRGLNSLSLSPGIEFSSSTTATALAFHLLAFFSVVRLC